MKVSDVTGATAEALRNVGAFAHDIVRPTLRLGVTGLSRAGKTVFITALVNNLLSGGRLAFFEAAAQGRLRRVYLEPQPDDEVPRFDYERHLSDLTANPPSWPQSTSRLSQLRLTLEFEPESFIDRTLGRDRLHVDIVDYPGEWLLDLPLLNQTYDEWSRQEMAMSHEPARKALSRAWHTVLDALDPLEAADEQEAKKASEAFTKYLRQCREQGDTSVVPPGRFLMPGELEGSPALTFSPLSLPDGSNAPRGSLWAMMQRRYEAYKTHIVKPFFRDHFARLDRQIVLIDALTALNGGKESLRDFERAMADILKCFRPGANSWLSSVLYRRIDRIVIAATKADHLHHSSHDRLEAIVARLAHDAIERADFAGADVKVIALASIRATREGEARSGGETLPCIIGKPMNGEKIGSRKFDGTEEFAIFPGDLPETPDQLDVFGGKESSNDSIEIIRFRPPDTPAAIHGKTATLPHIRLDRAINFLLGDRLE